MRMKVSNYIAQKLVDEGITQVFSVTGGGAMHLNDALGHQKGLTCLYNHHEQASAIAAESYARIHNQDRGALRYYRPWRDQRHYRSGRRMAGFYPYVHRLRAGAL